VVNNEKNEEPGSAGVTAADLGMFDIRHLSVTQLAQLGVSQIAYVRPVIVNGAPAFAIHAADGTPMAVASERELAVAAIRQHEMIPASVH
jgi:hypothetical protein